MFKFGVTNTCCKLDNYVCDGLECDAIEVNIAVFQNCFGVITNPVPAVEVNMIRIR